MTKFKRALAALAASAMMFTMSGCSDTRYAMTYDDGTKVNAGVYIYNLYTEMSYQLTMSYYTTGTMELDLDSDMEGQKLRDYLVEQARTATKECVAVTYQFEKLGLTLTDDEAKEISDNVASIWESSGDLMEAEGISKESIRQVLKSQTMRTRLFDYYYAEGGVEGVTDDDLKAFFEENFIRYKSIRINKSAAEDEAEANKENEKNKALRDEFLDKAKGLDFDEFDSVIDEYDEYVKSLEDSETSDDEDAADDVVGPSMASEDDDEADEATTDSEDTADSDELSPNEAIVNYGTMNDETKETLTGKMAAFMSGIDINTASAYEDDSFYYILIKGDNAEKSAKYVSDNRSGLLAAMKNDDFQAKIDSWIEELNIVENADAIKRYTAQVVYDKQIEFYGY